MCGNIIIIIIVIGAHSRCIHTLLTARPRTSRPDDAAEKVLSWISVMDVNPILAIARFEFGWRSGRSANNTLVAKVWVAAAAPVVVPLPVVVVVVLLLLLLLLFLTTILDFVAAAAGCAFSFFVVAPVSAEPSNPVMSHSMYSSFSGALSVSVPAPAPAATLLLARRFVNTRWRSLSVFCSLAARVENSFLASRPRIRRSVAAE